MGIAHSNWETLDSRTTGGRHLVTTALPRSHTADELRRLQSRPGLRVAGFRPGKAPISHFYRMQRKAVDAHMISLLRQELPQDLEEQLQSAAVPPQYVARGLTADMSFSIEVRWFSLPEAPDPRGQLGDVAGAAPGTEPNLPAQTPTPLERYLPKVETPFMAEHNLHLGRQLDPRRSAGGVGQPQDPGASWQEGTGSRWCANPADPQPAGHAGSGAPAKPGVDIPSAPVPEAASGQPLLPAAKASPPRRKPSATSDPEPPSAGKPTRPRS